MDPEPGAVPLGESGSAVADDTAAATAAAVGAERPARPPDLRRGSGLIVASWVGTAVYGALAVATTIAFATFQTALVIVGTVLFIVGCIVGFAAYVIAIARSRRDAIGMGGLFFLSGSAPARVQRHLLGSFVVECVVAIATASVGFATVPADSNNSLAVGVLTPMYGLGLAGLWGARHGRFAPRAAPPQRPRNRAGTPTVEAPDPTG
jgi:hypothetical protein